MILANSYCVVNNKVNLLFNSDALYSTLSLWPYYQYHRNYVLSNSYITAARDVWRLLHRSTRARSGPRAEVNKIMPCIPSACDITILYPVGTATMDMLRKLEFLKRKTQRQVYLTRNGLTKPLFESTGLERRSNLGSKS